MLKSIVSKLTQIAVISTCLTLTYSAIYPAKASVEVNVNLLNYVVESCQKNPPKDSALFEYEYTDVRESCIKHRYKYTLFVSKYNGLKNLGDLRPGFLSPLAVFVLSYLNSIYAINTEIFLDCMVNGNKNSELCSSVFGPFENQSQRELLASICSSCFNAYLNPGLNDLTTRIADDFISWFYKLDKPNRKLVVDAISDQKFMWASRHEAHQSLELYRKIEEKLKREEQERRRQDLLN
jgi:hypothetical protein